MARVIITHSLENQISKVFKRESIEIFQLLLTLEENPKKGKDIGNVGGIIIKELKYKKFRFYFIADGHHVKFLPVYELQELLIKFVRMSEKNDQPHVINEIKHVLRTLGQEGFN